MTSLTSAAITTTEQQQQQQQTMCQLIELSAIRRLLNPTGGEGVRLGMDLRFVLTFTLNATKFRTCVSTGSIYNNYGQQSRYFRAFV